MDSRQIRQGADPIGALTTLLPTWYLVLFAIVAIGGLIGGAVLDIYSSGLALLTLGLRVPRWMAAGFDGVIQTGLVTSSGCGSKVIATTGSPRSLPSSAARSTMR